MQTKKYLMLVAAIGLLVSRFCYADTAQKYFPITSSPFAEVNAKDGDNGFLAEYFSGADFSGKPVTTRLEGFVGLGRSPVPAVAGRNFSVRWAASITPTRSGMFTLSLRATGVAVLKLDGKALLETDGSRAFTERSTAMLEMDSAKPYEIVVELKNSDGTAKVAAEWGEPKIISGSNSAVDNFIEPVVGPPPGSIIGSAMEWKNDAYRLQSMLDGTLVLTEKESGASTMFKPQFSVVWQRKGSESKMDGKGGKYLDDGPVGFINYVVPSWDKETDFLKAARPRTKVTAAKVETDAQSARWIFSDQPEYKISAEVRMPEGQAEPLIKFQFNAKADGQFSVGYVGAPSVSSASAQWIWQPLVWTGKRFPNRSYLTKEFECPIPWVMFGAENKAIGVGADTSEIPYRMPTAQNSRFGVVLRNAAGEAQPMIFAPVLGGPDSTISAGQNYQFTLRLAVRQGDWYSTYRHLALELYGFGDIRENSLCSLNTTIENMMDYLLTDKYSYWFPQYKTWSYQNDGGPGSGRQQSAADAVSLALVCDNLDFYQRRALPTLEYMLSRNTVSMNISHPGFMGGFVNQPADLVAAYNLTGRRNPVIRKLFEKPVNELADAKRKSPPGSIMSLRTEMLNGLTQFRLTGQPEMLQKSCVAADRYIELRVQQPAKDFLDAGSSFWHEQVPAFDVLYELYGEAGQKKYLEAAIAGLRDFTAYTYLVPEIPAGNFVANPGGVYNGQPVPQESVPAWRVSANGLTAECGGTAHSHRGVFMAPHASDMARMAYDANDKFLSDIARSAVVGRYANYPSYAYRNGYSTVYEKADYPLHTFEEIKKFTSAHYNHPLPMCMFLVDYLVSETYGRSEGKIEFPSEYTTTGAYFRNKVYGAKPGVFYGETNVFLWLPKGLLKADSLQVNYIAGRGNGKLYLAFANQSSNSVTTSISLNPKLVVASGEHPCQVWTDNVSSSPMVAKEGHVTLKLTPKGITCLVIAGVEVKVGVQEAMLDASSPPLPAESFAMVNTAFGEVTATALRFGKGLTTVHVWLKAGPKQVRSAELNFNLDGVAKLLKCSEYPFEFTVPVADAESMFECQVRAQTTDGANQVSQPIIIQL